MTIQWFPGHMAKTERLIKENSKLVDVIIELVDARVPQSSRNPRLGELSGNLPVVLAMTKTDLADENTTREWLKVIDSPYTALLDLKTGRGIDFLKKKVVEAGKGAFQRMEKRGRMARPLRAMIVGVPNVGKSTLINRLAGGKPTKVGNRPGVTKGKQWIKAGKFELMDTPGVLWPRFENQAVGAKLAVTGAIRDEVVGLEDLSLLFIKYLQETHPGVIEDRYGAQLGSPVEILEEIGRKRGCLVSGGEIDTEKAAQTLLGDYRNGRLGRLSLERPGEGDNLWIKEISGVDSPDTSEFSEPEE